MYSGGLVLSSLVSPGPIERRPLAMSDVAPQGPSFGGAACADAGCYPSLMSPVAGYSLPSSGGSRYPYRDGGLRRASASGESALSSDIARSR